MNKTEEKTSCNVHETESKLEILEDEYKLKGLKEVKGEMKR